MSYIGNMEANLRAELCTGSNIAYDRKEVLCVENIEKCAEAPMHEGTYCVMGTESYTGCGTI